MKKHIVIKNTPTKFPLQSTILYTFLLYYFQVNGVFWGIFITIYSIYWAIVIYIKLHEEKIELNPEKNNPMKKVNRCENCLTSFNEEIEVYKQEKLICKKCNNMSEWAERLKKIINEH